MDVRVLRYFVTVAREGSVTRAANFLHVTQPTLSRQIKELEEELGSKLFVRSNYSIKLTDEGRLLRRRAEDILDLVDKTRAEFLSLHDVTGGDIRIGAAESYVMEYVAEVAKSIHSQYPNVKFHLYSGNYEEVTERLDKGLLDFCLLVDPVDVTKYNQLSLPARDTWGVVMLKDSPLAEKKSVSASDLVTLPLIFSRQAISHELSGWFGERMDGLNIVATYNLVFNASILVRKGVGYLLAFDRIVDTGENSQLTFRPLRPRLQSSLSIAWKKFQVFSPAEELFLLELQDLFPEQGDQ